MTSDTCTVAEPSKKDGNQMTTQKRALRRIVAGAGALVLAAAGLVASGSAAYAAPGPGQEGAPDEGSLTIHKFVGDEGDAGDGTEQTVDAEPLDDVEFTIWRLGVEENGSCVALDMTDTEHWNFVPDAGAPRTLDGVEAAGFCLSGDPVTGTTDGNGELTFDGLALGLYYVQETAAPAEVVSRTAPFYVSIPLPHDTESWVYDVHAYPKNQVADAPEKTINPDDEQPDNGLVLGSIVEWTISQTVPQLNDGDSYESASIWDYLPSSLEYDQTLSVTLNGTELAEGTDYEVDATGVTWTLLPNGLAQLTAGDVIDVTFTTKVVEVPENGEIANPGSDDPENPGYGSEFNGGKTPGDPTPYTYWGQLSILKTDDSTPAQNLSGAEFKVFETAADGTCAAEAPASGEIATGLSNANGIVEWAGQNPNTHLGLWIANSADGPLPSPSKDYCLYETVVPAGHTALPIDNPITIEPGTVDLGDTVIVNPISEGPDLPLTGAQGALFMTIGGLLLIALGAGAVVLSRRRQHAES